MWGTPRNKTQRRITSRFIPTYVGNTYSARFKDDYLAVHPHVCGEHTLTLDLAATVTGSSPRMWGTPREGAYEKLNERFIPTYVGNTRLQLNVSPGRTVHPHVCGEHTTTPRISRWRFGSSPRMWGTPDRLTEMEGMRRFIPTYVGNTGLNHATTSSFAVHPHVCGEHIFCY